MATDIALILDPVDADFYDLELDGGDLVLNDGLDGVTQDIMQRMQFYFAEWFLNTEQGVPYFQQILVKNPDQGAIDAIFKNVILSTPGIISLDEYGFVVDRQTRKLTVRFRAKSTSGPIDYFGVI